MVRRFACLSLLFALIAVPALAQSQAAAPKPKPASELSKSDAPAPALTDVQKLTLQNVLLRIELAQRQAQQAQSDFDKARGEAQQLVQSLQVPGYDLDIAAMKYTAAKQADPVPAPAPAPPKK